MTDEKKKEIIEAFGEFCMKHNLKYGVMAAQEIGSDSYVAGTVPAKSTETLYLLANAARLFQFLRQAVKSMMDAWEREVK